MIVQFIALLFFAAFADFLLPEGKYTRYISFVLGLVLIAVALSPILSLQDLSLSTEWEATVPQITYKAEEKTDDIFARKLEEYVRKTLGAEVKVNVTAKEIVSVEGANGNKAEIAKLLGISEEKVCISN